MQSVNSENKDRKKQKTRMNASHNGFVRTCCQQEIDQLRAEKEAIEAEVIG